MNAGPDCGLEFFSAGRSFTRLCFTNRAPGANANGFKVVKFVAARRESAHFFGGEKV
jgi:hypothetical protein